MPSPVRFEVVKRMLQAKGYHLARVKGSHHVFKKHGAHDESVPVHKGLVKYGYVRRIEKLP